MSIQRVTVNVLSLLSALYPGKDTRAVIAENAALLGYPDLVSPARAATLNISIPPRNVADARAIDQRCRKMLREERSIVLDLPDPPDKALRDAAVAAVMPGGSCESVSVTLNIKPKRGGEG